MASFKFDTRGLVDPVLRAYEGLGQSFQNLGRTFGRRREDKARRAYQTSERVAGQEYRTGEREAGEVFSASEREAIQAYQDARDLEERGFLTGEREAGEEFRTGEREAGEAFRTGEREEAEGYMTGERVASEIYATAQALLGRDFTTSEREAVETFQAQEAATGREFVAGENLLGREFQTGERVGGEAFRTGERVAGQEYGTGEREATEVYRTGERKDIQGFNREERIAGEAFRTNERIGSQAFATYENALDRLLKKEGLDVDRLREDNLNVYRNAMMEQSGKQADAADVVEPPDMSQLPFAMFEYAKESLMGQYGEYDPLADQGKLIWPTDEKKYSDLKQKVLSTANAFAIRLLAPSMSYDEIQAFLEEASVEILNRIPALAGGGEEESAVIPESGISVAKDLVFGLAGPGRMVAEGAVDYVKNLSGWLRGTVAPRTVKGEVGDETTEAFAWALVQKLQELDLTDEERSKIGNAATFKGYEWDLQKPIRGGTTSKLPEILDYVVRLAQQYGLGAEAQ